MWGRELPRRRPWDQSRLMDPAHPLFRGETLAVHLRLSGKKGSVWLHHDDAQERNTEWGALTHKQREGLSCSSMKASTVGCNCRWLCVRLCDAWFPGCVYYWTNLWYFHYDNWKNDLTSGKTAPRWAGWYQAHVCALCIELESGGFFA